MSESHVASKSAGIQEPTKVALKGHHKQHQENSFSLVVAARC